MKKILNKWQLHWLFFPDYERRETGWRRWEFGIFKIINFPREGQLLFNDPGNRMYWGFLIKLRIWFPFEII